jgi:hypothetical protein
MNRERRSFHYAASKNMNASTELYEHRYGSLSYDYTFDLHGSPLLD